MFAKYVYLFIFILCGICESSFVERLMKCHYKDEYCIKSLIHNVLKDLSRNGVQELNVPPIDPYIVNNKQVPYFGLFNLTLERGEIRGASDCKVNAIDVDLKNGVTNADIICNAITLDTKLNFKDVTSLGLILFDQDLIHGDGNVRVSLDNLLLKIQVFFDVIRKQDGDIYFKIKTEEFSYKYDIGNLRMGANKIYFLKQDISTLFVNYFNQNWQVILPTFGKGLLELISDIFTVIIDNFFDKLPGKYFFIDNLSPFVKN